MDRRSAIKALGTATLGSVALFDSATASQSTEKQPSSNGSVIYHDERGKILKISPYSYVIRGAKTEEDFEFLLEKRRQLLLGDDKEVSNQDHSDSGISTDDGDYQGKNWDVRTEFEATADNGVGTMNGTAEANWWGTGYWVDDPIEVEEIEISSVLRAEVENVDSLTISASPAYKVQEEYRKATLTDTFVDENHPSLAHEDGAVVFTVDNCFRWIEQDDRFKYKYETGDTEFYGTYVRANVGHCL